MTEPPHVGERVTLRSGGPVMVVERIDRLGRIHCRWWNDLQQVLRSSFSVELLIHAPPEAPHLKLVGGSR